MSKVKVAKFSEVPEGELRKVDVNGEPVALFNIAGQIYATTNICTHEQCELDENHLIHGEEVECTCHGSRYDIKTGKNTLPPSAEPLKTYMLTIENDEIYIEI